MSGDNSGGGGDAPSASSLRRIAEASGIGRLLRARRHPNLASARRDVLASGTFDADWYATEYTDVRASGIDPLDHYILRGRGEGRLPGPPRKFAQARELREYADQLLLQSSQPLGSGPDYIALSGKSVDSSAFAIKTIAFYLPQFHPIPENDAWWGRGFTEWTNVSKAAPQFVGHYQPHLPGELGFYDLRVPEVMARQVELATQYGLAGFCFHTYWFGGKRLLTRPLDQFLAHKEWNLGFCLCWANENWTRRWDGLESDILIGQSHSPEDDISFIQAMTPYLTDERYFRIDGKPLLIVYRPALLPSARATTQHWREFWAKERGEELYLATAQAFDHTGADPREMGFDAAIEFPPHQPGIELAYEKLSFVNPDFIGHVFEYRDLADAFCRRAYSGHTVFRTLAPGWDNTARKLSRAHIFANVSQEIYTEWLDTVCRLTMKRPPAERLIFINAWNEWAEGAHLEPDRRFGYAFLQATADVLSKYPSEAP